MKEISLLIVCFLFTVSINAQTYRARVVASGSGEGLSFAVVTVGEQSPFYADTDGYFNVENSGSGDELLTVSYVGYKPFTRNVDELEPDKLNRLILELSADLPTVTVSTPSSVFNRSLSIVSPSIEELERVPLLAGESDILKALQLLPGISGTTEGTAGLSIRGGNTSQTHLIVDGNAVYNANHIGGFISSLPSFGVKKIDVYKGGMPARYGGRLSGVVDVQLRDGRQDHAANELAIGTGLLRAGMEGPLGKRWTYLATGRVAYPTLVSQLASAGSYKRGESGSFEIFNLRDAVAKLSYRNDRLVMRTSVFASGDSGFSQNEFRVNRFAFDEFSWSNLSLSQQFSYELGTGLIAKGALLYNRYGYDYGNRLSRTVDEEERVSINRIKAALEDPGARLSLNYQPSHNLLISIGGNATRHGFSHRQSGTNDEGIEIPDTLNLSQNSTELNAYAQIRAELLKKRLQVEAGLRNSNLVEPRFSYLEPRLRVGYNFGDLLSLNVGLDYNTQFLHQISADETVFPNELWLIASNRYRPARAKQYFVGAATLLKRWEVEISVEAFSKTMTGLSEANPFRANGATSAADFLSTVISNGEGRVKGLEFFLKKETNRLTGSLAYTLSFSERRYPELNEGDWFPFTYDKKHDLALSIGYELSKNWYFTGTFVFQTGRAVSIPILTSPLFDIFGRVNNGRFPPYHRLNLGFEKKWTGKKRANHHHTLSFSLYNAYNRQNPYAISLVPVSTRVINPDTGMEERINSVEINTRSLLPIVPGIAYKRSIR